MQIWKKILINFFFDYNKHFFMYIIHRNCTATSYNLHRNCTASGFFTALIGKTTPIAANSFRKRVVSLSFISFTFGFLVITHSTRDYWSVWYLVSATRLGNSSRQLRRTRRQIRRQLRQLRRARRQIISHFGRYVASYGGVLVVIVIPPVSN